MIQSTRLAAYSVIAATFTGAVWGGVGQRLALGPLPHYQWVGVMSLTVSLAALALHIWVGWDDAHRFTLHPSGAIGILAFLGWLIAILTGLAALVITRRRPKYALLSLGICAATIAYSIVVPERM